MSGPAFWEGLYARGEDGWELGAPAPALAAWLGAGGRFAPGARVAVPGCGRGHDVRLLARHGYRAQGFDFAASAVAAARARAAGTLLGCFYPLREGTEGPPFPVSLAEVEGLLEDGFRIVESAAPAAAAERRRGQEWLIRAVRR